MNLSSSDRVYFENSIINDGYYGGNRVYAWDQDIQVYIKNATSNGSVITNSQRFPLVDLARSLKASGVWSKIQDFSLFAGVDYSGSKIKIKGSASLVSYNFTSSDYLSSGSSAGLKGNGSTKYLDTQFNASSGDASNMGLFCYMTGRETAGTSRYLMGAQGAANTPQNIVGMGFLRGGTQDCGGIAIANTTTAAPSTVDASTYSSGALFVGTNGSRAQQFYRNGVAVGSTVTATASLPNLNIWLFRANNSNASLSTRRILSYAITKGMTAADVKSLSDTVNTYMAAFNANVY